MLFRRDRYGRGWRNVSFVAICGGRRICDTWVDVVCGCGSNGSLSALEKVDSVLESVACLRIHSWVKSLQSAGKFRVGFRLYCFEVTSFQCFRSLDKLRHIFKSSIAEGFRTDGH